MNSKKQRSVIKQGQAVQHFFVVRHGETRANLLGINAGPLSYPLTRRGIKEIEFLSKALSKIQISGIYSSPIFRAVETSKILARPHGLEVQIVEDLTEVKLKPKFVGKKGRRRILMSPEDFDESSQELQDRMVNAFKRIKNESKGNVMIVSHGDPITALLEYTVERTIGTKKYYVLHPDPGSVSIIKFEERPQLVLFNYHRKQFRPKEL
jgi:broad specificity phosphatase PhoE